MPKFLFYITDLMNGTVYGTDYVQKAEDAALSEDNFVVDALNGEWIQSSLERDPIQEA